MCRQGGGKTRCMTMAWSACSKGWACSPHGVASPLDVGQALGHSFVRDPHDIDTANVSIGPGVATESMLGRRM
jgi:hypothetical protein